uniref:Uncharacterized protein n=1 Tax=Timema poppense TaxID=170557 RepID=A0A7R9DJ08_TIMPO|nr:unnamed protein product [Timema poppensis]
MFGWETPEETHIPEDMSGYLQKTPNSGITITQFNYKVLQSAMKLLGTCKRLSELRARSMVVGSEESRQRQPPIDGS